ncbi:AAA domain-containing protein [Amycolatopsis minnesotensis]|uniref:AAA domain-containing protein n=1 Tax=Amycolatopsis minnesotensis TaxID=337894 RepID=A0ABN2RMV1_9PSEU
MTESLVERARNLFEFLKRAQELKTTPPSTVDSYQNDGIVLWLADCPDHDAVQTAHDKSAPQPDEPLLVVNRVPRGDPPELDDELAAWLHDEVDNPEQAPRLRSEILVAVEENGDAQPRRGEEVGDKGQPLRKITIEERPEIRHRYERWLALWRTWAEQELKNRPAREYYQTLFETYVQATSNPEAFELVVAMGCLSWAPADHRVVKRHLLTCPVAVTFDDSTAQLSVHRTESPVAFRVERDMLEPRLVNNPENVANVEADARYLDTHPLNRAEIGGLARRLVHSLDAEGEYRDQDDAPAPATNAVGAFAPAIILRKRTERGLVEIFRTIVEQLTETGEVPDGILPLIDPDEVRETQPATDAGAVVAVDDDLFLPMPVNDKQLEVIKRVDAQAQVLVQGPPGTGKTHTAAALISHLLAQGKRVLVTAQTDRALREVRDKLPEAIKPLSVAVVGTSREDMADLKIAVQQIAAATAEHDGARNDRDIQNCLDAIDRLRRERAGLYNHLIAAREHEIVEHEHAGYSGTLAGIARRLGTETSLYEWLLDYATVGPGEQPPLANAEIGDWRGLLLDDELIADEPESRMRLLERDAVPPPETFARLGDAEYQAAERNKEYEQLKTHAAFGAVARLNPDMRDQLRHRLGDIADEANALAGRPEQWMKDALADVRSGRAGVWQNRAGKIDEIIAHCQPAVEKFGALTEVTMPENETGRLLALAGEVRRYIGAGGQIKTTSDGTPKLGAFAPKVLKQAQPLFEQVRVDGLPPVTADKLEIVLAWGDATRTLAALDRAWPDNVAVPAEDTLHERLQWHLTELGQLRRVLNLGGRLDSEERAMARAGLPAPAWHDPHAVRAYAKLVDAAAAQDAWTAAVQPLLQLTDIVDAAARWAQAASTVRQLHAAVHGRDYDSYAVAYQRLTRLADVRGMAARRELLATRLAEQAPALARAISEAPGDVVWTQRLSRFEQAWTWASTMTWVREQEAGDVNAMQDGVARAEDKIRAQIEKIAALRAWDHAASPARITNTARADLTHYAQLVKRAGKLTGKYATDRKAEVRNAMDRCRPSVPAWIMPIYRIADQLRIEPDMFDVVVVDEASQAGTEASFLQYLAKKIVVIGDDKQVSPAAVGLELQPLRDLARQYLAHDPYRSTWQEPTQSLFDEAKKRYGKPITLTEHRRCVPEIIGFSNRIAYEPEGIRLVPVRQYGTDRLEPIRAVHLADGYVRGRTNKVNPVEVEAIVEQVEKCIADPAYDGKSFGVISLLGPAQAKQVQDQLLNRIPGREWKARDLRCGDAADFQGSERDVMFLSMVAAPVEGERMMPLTHEQYVQRFNVAVSRAKDQVWVFHSVDVKQLHNKEDMRFALLDYCYGVINRGSASNECGNDIVPEDELVDPFDSLFEQRVYNRIVDRGYNVFPQYDAAGYRIDLVVMGGNTRLAVECDGDAWHGPEVYEGDLARQRELERCGWQFFRIPGSAFDVDRAEALAGLWDMLRELEIHPSGQHAEVTPETEPSELTIETATESDSEPLGRPAGNAAAAERLEVHEPAEQVRLTEESDDEVVPHPVALAGSFAPYVEFSGSVEPVHEATRAQLVAGLEQIVLVEGPMVGSRLHSAYVKAAGGSRVGPQIAKTLNSAISSAVRRGALVSTEERGGVKWRTYRTPDQPLVRVRDLGPRQLDQMPPDELAAVMAIAADEDGWADDDRIFRATLDHLGLVRLTKQVREHLASVLALARRTQTDGSQRAQTVDTELDG